MRRAPAETPPDQTLSEAPVDEGAVREHSHHRRRRATLSLSVMAGASGRGRNDLRAISTVLGPAGEPSPLVGVFALQLAGSLRYFRVGVDFTGAWTRASGNGTDLGGIAVRQAVEYSFYSGGVLLEGVAPVSKTVDLSFGSTIGGGGMHIHAMTTRVSDFADLGADLRAVAKTQELRVFAPMLHAKPAVGARIKLGQEHAVAAFDVRIGLNVYWVPRGSMRLENDVPLYNSPTVVELQPFILAGIAFGDFHVR